MFDIPTKVGEIASTHPELMIIFEWKSYCKTVTVFFFKKMPEWAYLN